MLRRILLVKKDSSRVFLASSLKSIVIKGLLNNLTEESTVSVVSSEKLRILVEMSISLLLKSAMLLRIAL